MVNSLFPFTRSKKMIDVIIFFSLLFSDLLIWPLSWHQRCFKTLTPCFRSCQSMECIGENDNEEEDHVESDPLLNCFQSTAKIIACHRCGQWNKNSQALM